MCWHCVCRRAHHGGRFVECAALPRLLPLSHRHGSVQVWPQFPICFHMISFLFVFVCCCLCVYVCVCARLLMRRVLVCPPARSRSCVANVGSEYGRVDSILTEELMHSVLEAKSRPDKGVTGQMSIGTVTALRMAAKTLARSTRAKVDARRGRFGTTRLESCDSEDSVPLPPVSAPQAQVHAESPAVGPTPVEPRLDSTQEPPRPWLSDAARAGSRHGLAAMSRSRSQSTSVRMLVPTGTSESP